MLKVDWDSIAVLETLRATILEREAKEIKSQFIKTLARVRSWSTNLNAMIKKLLCGG